MEQNRWEHKSKVLLFKKWNMFSNCGIAQILGSERFVYSILATYRPYAKMAVILIFFCIHSNQLYQPRSRVKLSKEYFATNEASRANLNVD